MVIVVFFIYIYRCLSLTLEWAQSRTKGACAPHSPGKEYKRKFGIIYPNPPRRFSKFIYQSIPHRSLIIHPKKILRSHLRTPQIF